MDSDRFDALTRLVAGAPTRRSVLRSVVGVVASAIGVGNAGRAAADLCKEDGKACKKDGQCCGGLCAPAPGSGSTAESDSICCTPEPADAACAGLCGQQTNNCGLAVDCGACCVPDSREVTCSGLCGPETNNCGLAVDCGLCAGDQCEANDQCASDLCCDTCVDCTLVSETAVSCGGCGNCCECFRGDSFGPDYCCDAGNICGTYPNDTCCANGTVCVGGTCIKPVYACPYEAGGALVDCQGQSGAGCCNGICCPNELPVCLNGACHAPLPACSYPDNLACPEGSTCTATKWNTSGVCCVNMGAFETGAVDDEGVPIVVNQCCSLNQQWPGTDTCPTCTPKHYCGCEECTSRTSTPRITG